MEEREASNVLPLAMGHWLVHRLPNYLPRLEKRPPSATEYWFCKIQVGSQYGGAPSLAPIVLYLSLER
jgi:hypothetical protein